MDPLRAKGDTPAIIWGVTGQGVAGGTDFRSGRVWGKVSLTVGTLGTLRGSSSWGVSAPEARSLPGGEDALTPHSQFPKYLPEPGAAKATKATL